MSAADISKALQDLIQALRLPDVCVHDEEPDYCDRCLYETEKATAVAVRNARRILAMPFTQAQIDQLRADVAAGAGHECSEWWEEGECLLCDRKRPIDELDCQINPVSSRTCERGTKSCTVRHG